MLNMPEQVQDDDVIVFLDFAVENEFAGRVVILLDKKTVPKSTENFRALCTGEKGIGELGKPLHYKGSIIHKVSPQFMIQGGDITDFNGTGGESIYGQYFEDENFKMKFNSSGMVGLVNTARPNTNNSQFFITINPCIHLNGLNVAIGRVIKGFGVVREISETEIENGRPILKYQIINCGQLEANTDYGINECDNTEDIYPPYPDDSDELKEMLWLGQLGKLAPIISNIKKSGNHFFQQERYFLAARKYKKAITYFNWYRKQYDEQRRKDQQNGKKLEEKNDKDEWNKLYTIRLNCLMNLSAVELKRQHYKRCVELCNEILKSDENNVKAIFRQGKANVALSNHDVGLRYLKRARSLRPYDKEIKEEIDRVKKRMNEYYKLEKRTFAKMFSN